MIIDKEIEVAEKVGDGYFTYKDARELQETLTNSLLRDTKEHLEEENEEEEDDNRDSGYEESCCSEADNGLSSHSEKSNKARGFSMKSFFVGFELLLLFLFLSVAAGIGNNINT